jgi:hypothetical protein
MSTVPEVKPSYKKGDIVNAPFASPNQDGTYSKRRTAYITDVVGNEATLVYISKSEKSRDGMPYTGDLDKRSTGLQHDSFYDASQTTKAPTDTFLKQSAKLSPDMIAEIESAITRERKDFRDAAAKVLEFREKSANAESPAYAADYAKRANALAAKAESEHRHVRIDSEGRVAQRTIEQGWKAHGNVTPTIAQEMKALAARYEVKAPTALEKPTDDRHHVVNPDGKGKLLGPKTVEHLKETFHCELNKAGHCGTLPDTKEVKSMATSVANAQIGERIAVSASGTHHVLGKEAPIPHGSTVMDAAALRASAKIAESALVKGLAGPQAKVFEGVMAAGVFFDNASGHALSGSLAGKAIGKLGESSGAFEVIMKTQQAVEPVLAKAEKAVLDAADKHGVTAFVGEQLARAERVSHDIGADKVIAKVGDVASAGVSKLETLIRENVHGPDNPASRQVPAHDAMLATPGARVQEQLLQGMQEAGKQPLKLSSEEGASLAKELAHVQPGDRLIVEKSGEVYLAVGPEGKGAQDFPKSATVFDADAMRENAGIAKVADMSQPKPQAQAETAQRTPEMTMSTAA